jgi:hypothetical protein
LDQSDTLAVGPEHSSFETTTPLQRFFGRVGDCRGFGAVFSTGRRYQKRFALSSSMKTRAMEFEERAGLEKSHFKNALFWLKSAAEAGLFNDPAVCDQARKDPDLAVLVERDEFRGIIGPPGMKF